MGIIGDDERSGIADPGHGTNIFTQINRRQAKHLFIGPSVLHQFVIGLIFLVFGIGPGPSWAGGSAPVSYVKEAENPAVPWVKVFDRAIYDVFIPARPFLRENQPVPPESVIIGTFDRRESMDNKLNVHRLENRPLILLSNFVTGETGEPGYVFWGRSLSENLSDLRENYAFPQDISPAVEVDLGRKLKDCLEQRTQGSPENVLFVTKDLTESQCLARTLTSFRQWVTTSTFPDQQTILPYELGIRVDSLPGQGAKNIHTFSICLESEGLYNPNQERVRSYLNLETNRIFGCKTYGRPLCYYRKDIGESLEEQPIYKYRKEYASWQKQYLIKTTGFRYYCWNAWRLIDEPLELGPILSDGTMLMWGEVSVLRVRLDDGSTSAPSSTVKVFDAMEIRRLLDRYGAQECKGESIAAGDCQLTTMPNNPLSNNGHKKNYKSLVIQAVDKILQKLFDSEQSSQESLK